MVNKLVKWPVSKHRCLDMKNVGLCLFMNSPLRNYLFVFPVSEPNDESWNNDHNWAQSVTCEI